jgi:hypothetical protein
MGQDTSKLPARFFDKIKISEDSGCWVWTAKKSKSGYGRYMVNSRFQFAHRVSYEALVGPIPAGLYVDHVCFNHACVNPEHLRATTRKQNAEHRQSANKQNRSGIRGVHNDRGRWRVRVGHNGRDVPGGHFYSLAEAEAAAIALRAKLFTHDDYRDSKDC